MLLLKCREELQHYWFSGDYGSYNNEGVINLCEEIDAYFRGDEPLKVSATTSNEE